MFSLDEPNEGFLEGAATLKLLPPAFGVQKDVALLSPHIPSWWLLYPILVLLRIE